MPKTNRRRTTHRKRTSQRKRKNAKKTGIKQRGGNTSVYYLVIPFNPNTGMGQRTIQLTTKIANPTMEQKRKLFYEWTSDAENSSFIYNYYFGNSQDPKYSPSFYINDEKDYVGSMENPVRVEISEI